MDAVTAVLTIEGGDATQAEQLQAWSTLIKSGLVWQLQGFYGRGATSLIENGYISSQGEILIPADELTDSDE